MKDNGKEFFTELKKDKNKLIKEMNKLIQNFEEKYQYVEIHQCVHSKFNSEKHKYTNFIRFHEIVMSFHLDTIEQRDEKNDKQHELQSKRKKGEIDDDYPKRG